MSGGRFHERDHTAVVKAGEFDTTHAGLSMQHRQRVEQRVSMRQLTGAISAEDQHTYPKIGCDEMTQQLEACRICRLQIVEHQHDRLMFRRGSEHSDYGCEQQEPLRIGVGRL